MTDIYLVIRREGEDDWDSSAWEEPVCALPTQELADERALELELGQEALKNKWAKWHEENPQWHLSASENDFEKNRALSEAYGEAYIAFKAEVGEELGGWPVEFYVKSVPYLERLESE
jgi:hypothetical protein